MARAKSLLRGWGFPVVRVRTTADWRASKSRLARSPDFAESPSDSRSFPRLMGRATPTFALTFLGSVPEASTRNFRVTDRPGEAER